MAEVFLSRPNWIAPEYEDGLNNFLTHLGDVKLNPRTIGKTDYPIGGPLDAVIDLMRKCVGCVVLGYPQIEMSQGKLKDKDLPAGSNLQLASEWNHIETSLAYMLKLPVLVIHHQDISRGIFDRGVCSLFLYSVDLKRRDWILDKGIRGAIDSFVHAIGSISKA